MIELSLALFAIAVLARDGFRAWLKHKAATEHQLNKLAELELAVAELKAAHTKLRDVEIKALAEDFKRSLKQVEANADAARKHVDAQVAGTLAQMPNTGRGFGR